MALIGNTYVLDTDPGAVGYGYFWQKMNGDRSARNTSNTAWVAQGNVNQAYSGAAPLSGFTAQGDLWGYRIGAVGFCGLPGIEAERCKRGYGKRP